MLILLFSVQIAAARGTGEMEESADSGESAAEEKVPAEILDLKAAAFKGPSGFGIIKLFEDTPDLGENVSIEFQVLPTPQEMVARVAGGEIDFAVFPSNMAAKLYSEGPGYKLGAITGMGVLSLVSRDPSIVSWSDLKGKTVNSVGKGATPDYLFTYLMQENGLDPAKDVQVDFSITNGAQLAQLIIGGKKDSAVLPEPFVTLVTKKAPDVKPVLDFQEAWKELRGSENSYPITVVVVKPELAEKRPEVVRAFLDAYAQSINWVNSHPEEAAPLIEKYGIMPAAIARPAIANCNLKFIPPAEARTIMEEYLRVLLEYNPASVGGRLPDEQFYFSY